jgi:thiol-disulfide isomerase/thioredoxin
MRRPILALVSAAVLTVPLAHAARVALAPGEEVPYLMGFDVWNGKSERVIWKGTKLTLVNFWATWCEPCRKEMPVLQEIHERFGQDGLRVVAVTKENVPYETLQEFVQQVGATFTALRAPEPVARYWGGMGSLPATYLVDERGRLLRRYVGYTEAQSKALVRDVESALAGRPLEPMELGEESEVISEDTVR